MDVVKRNVQAMGGRIAVHSEPGRGCRFTLSLPLTLAVLDGMVLKLGAQRYVVPLQSVIETTCSDSSVITTLAGGREVMRMRDRLILLARLAHLVGQLSTSGQQGSSDADSDEVVLVVVETEGG